MIGSLENVPECVMRGYVMIVSLQNVPRKFAKNLKPPKCEYPPSHLQTFQCGSKLLSMYISNRVYGDCIFPTCSQKLKKNCRKGKPENAKIE